MSDCKISVCTRGKTCRKRGAKAVFCALESEIEQLGLAKTVKLKKTDCMGHCGRGPAVRIKPDKVFYGCVSVEDCAELVSSVVRRMPLQRLRLKKSS